jgi:ferrochelatase
LVFAPAFTSDCLETIEEIGHEYNSLFQSLGGELVQLVPGLNDNKEWIDALYSLATK